MINPIYLVNPTNLINPIFPNNLNFTDTFQGAVLANCTYANAMNADM